jgi:methionyl-tRNA synthetase
VAARKKSSKQRLSKKPKKGKRAAKAAAKKRVVKKAKRAKKPNKPAAKRAAKKPAAKKTAKKSAKKTTAARPVSASTPTQATRKAEKKPAAGTAKKPAPVAAAQAPRKNIYYITTAIAYPNGVPHIGHAYEAIATDALARFQRLDGKDVFFLTGTDEHGLKMVQTAEAEKLPTKEVATRNAARFKDMDG